MTQPFLDKWLPQLNSIVAYARSRPLLTTVAISAIPLLSHAIASYRGFIAVGRGGIPNNIFGWLIQLAGQPIGWRNMTSLEPYHDPKAIAQFGPHGRKSFLGDAPLPQRRGDRPEVPTYVAPQRQTSETCREADVERLNLILADVANQNSDLLAIRNSVLELKDSMALWLNVDVVSPPSYLARATKGELFHVHHEGSAHTILSLADAEAAVRQGWAQRHKLSGVTLPLSYVLIYAPRDDDEVQIWRRFVGAAVGFAAANLGK